MRLADYVADRLEQIGVKTVFLVTGRGSLYLSDALARNKNINSISTHHEQSAGYAAIAAASFEVFGVCALSTGCGSTNAISAVLSAWQDEVPVVFISGQNSLKSTTRYNASDLRTYGEQETDIIELVKPITKYSTMLTDPSQIAWEIDRLFYEAKSGRMGPVWLDIPLDLQSSNVNPEALIRFEPDRPQFVNNPIDSANQIWAKLHDAKRPVFVFGQGALKIKNKKSLVDWIETSQIPVVFDSSAPAFIPSTAKFSIGSAGAMGCSRAGNFVLQNSDLVIFVGSQIRTSLSGDSEKTFARAADFVVIDSDSTQLRPEIASRSEFYEFSDELFERLLENQVSGQFTQWLDQAMHWKNALPLGIELEQNSGVDLYELSLALTETMPSDACVITDSGLVELILPTNIAFQPTQTPIHPYSQGAMGFALPAAIGAASSSDGPVITIIGDGSIMMNLQELQTVRHLNLGIKIIVLENNAYAIIRKRQKELFRSRTIGTDSSNGVSCPSFEKVAKAFDITYMQVDSPGEVRLALKKLFEISGPAICEIRGLPEQQYLRTSRAVLDNGANLQRPLEDQEPFLPRDLIESEMIIQPVNLR